MIQLPADFNAAALFTEFYELSAPFVGIALLISCGFLILKILKKVP